MTGINAKVATVLNDRRLVVNAGSTAGVNLGDSVTLWSVVEVTDPDTKEALGVVKTPKLVLTVDEVQERMAIASILAETINIGQVLFNPRPSKRIMTSGAPTTGDSVRVVVGEQATLRPASRKSAS